MDHVTDPEDPRLADYRDLTDARARRLVEGTDGHGLFIAEGTLAVTRVLEGGLRLRSVVVTPSRARSEDTLLARIPDGVPVLVADRPALARVAGYDVHRGLLASVERPPLPSCEQLTAGTRSVAVLEGVNDHENLGAVFRNAAALGLDAVVLDPRCADPLYRRSVRVSVGWSATLPHTRCEPLPAGLEPLRRHGHRVVALTPAPSARPVDEAAGAGVFDGPVALVLGAEGPGLSEATAAAADERVAVPMAPGVDSLNVATALAVVAAFAAARRGWSG